MGRQAIDVHGRIAFSNANCALLKTGQKRRWRKVRVNSSFAKPGLVLQLEQPVDGQERGVGNYGSARLLASSVGRGWLASSLAARLVQNHVGTLARDVSARATQAGLDRRRLTRVLDYIGANLEGD
jgi:hypothetical protein